MHSYSSSTLLSLLVSSRFDEWIILSQRHKATDQCLTVRGCLLPSHEISFHSFISCVVLRPSPVMKKKRIMEWPGSSRVDSLSLENSRILYSSKNRPPITIRCMDIKQLYIYSETYVHTSSQGVRWREKWELFTACGPTWWFSTTGEWRCIACVADSFPDDLTHHCWCSEIATMNDVRSDVYTINCQKLVDHKNRNTFNYTSISHSRAKSNITIFLCSPLVERNWKLS